MDIIRRSEVNSTPGMVLTHLHSTKGHGRYSGRPDAFGARRIRGPPDRNEVSANGVTTPERQSAFNR
jgi:hypothetical protein